ncbi:DUF2085 domain-containing protein [Metabacillus malikii]|uniref:Membrane protein n=1 Tax=Metabacillus malikii TaxID=1504265 RepID=A0ABT9ZDI0_9BACI|nr:DUF2085 domain-containing protein [Metabacillus malikii]MDQ0229638.1 putative membrane protein [Metabacillus malikii]
MKELLDIIPCHRIPERCLHIKGKPMPLCTRCFAILIGYLFTPIALIAEIAIPLWLPFILALPLLIDGFTQRWKWRKSTNSLRFLTGLLFGVGQSLFISSIVVYAVDWLS